MRGSSGRWGGLAGREEGSGAPEGLQARHPDGAMEGQKRGRLPPEAVPSPQHMAPAEVTSWPAGATSSWCQVGGQF